MFARLRTGLLFAAFLLLAPALAHSAVLENPADGQLHSGVGVISGWKCSAGRLSIRFNGSDLKEMNIPLTYGTIREDVADKGFCGGHEDVGFVALYNWSKLGNGTHTAVVYDDDVEFARSTFTVGSTGRKFLTGASGSVIVPDFPIEGQNQEFEWNQSTQHMEMVSPDRTPVSGAGSQSPGAFLDNPTHGLNYSGIGVVSGWHCNAGTLTYSVDGETPIPLVWRESRKDVRDAGECSRSDVGFVAIQNYANFGAGEHTLVVYNNGVEFARSTFTVGHPTVGGSFIRGASARVTVGGIPSSGKSAEFEWNQNTQHLEMVCQHNCSGPGNGSDPPSFGEATIADQSYTPNTAITSLTLPAATGGTAPLVYSLSPALPAGLSFNQTTRELSGTPTSTLNATTYTYTATDEDGATATLTFSITVGTGGNGGGNDDHGNTAATATPVSLPYSTTGNLETAGDMDYFQVEVTQSGTLTMTITATDIYVFAKDGNDHFLISYTDASTPDNASRVDLVPGTYYVLVEGSEGVTGSYTLAVSFSTTPPPPPSDDHGDSCSAATRVGYDSITRGEFETGGDEDFFEFTTSSAARYYVITTTGSTDTKGELYSTSRPTDDDSGEGRNFQIVRRLSPNDTFCVRVSGYSSSTTGSYTLHIRRDHGDTKDEARDSATLVDINSSMGAELDTLNDQDWFKVNFSSSRVFIRVYSTAPDGNTEIDPLVEAYDRNGIIQFTNGDVARDDDSGPGNHFELEWNHNGGGPVWFRVTGGKGDLTNDTGRYIIHIQVSQR